MNNIRLFLSDCDGVLTDAGIYYFESGDEAKKFNTRDGMAFKLLKEQNIKIGIITGEKSKIVKNRGKKLKMDYIFMNAKNKVLIIEKLLKQLNLTYNNVAYIGDDINDLELLKKVGFSACPLDAEDIIKKNVMYISEKKGGSGVVRDVYNKYFNNVEGGKNEQ